MTKDKNDKTKKKRCNKFEQKEKATQEKMTIQLKEINQKVPAIEGIF